MPLTTRPRMTCPVRLLASSMFAAALCLLIPDAIPAQSSDTTHVSSRPRMVAAARSGPIVLDGRLDESAWSASIPATGFTQSEPNEGSPATQPTEVRILYDDAALYIGARMFDSLGARGVRSYLSRRDQQEDGDYLEIIFDTFHDHTGRTVFQINPAGVKTDAGQASSNADPSWDPIWEAETSIDSLGWVAEIRIPFAQLRFSRDAAQTWGLQIWRYVDRIREVSMWAFWKRNAPGGPPYFGHAEGIRVTERPRGIELLPYVVSRAAYVPISPDEQGNPFLDDSEYTMRVGGDLKALLTSNLTLDLTVNPDFGQVEVDPAVVNLTAFETSFQEKRPFFVEGSGVFGFGGLSCYVCSNVSGMSMYYSRRIGRQPRGSPPDGYEYLDRPDNATILGAAKITGRTRGGYNLGLLNAVTKSEKADVAVDSVTRVVREVEPLTNYFVGRGRKIFSRGRGFLGAIGTSTIRRFQYDSLALSMPKHAEAFGIDGEWWWLNRTYRLMGNLALSNVAGDPAVITDLQEASARYFNRPDRKHGDNDFFSDRYDPALSVLRGYGGYLRAAKESGNWLFESSLNVRSPGFEVNDLAFLTRSDYAWMNGNVFRQWTRPTKYFREAYWIVGAQQQYNFDGDRTDLQFHQFVQAQFPNYWGLSSFFSYRPEVFEDRLTRGGPVVKRSEGWFGELFMNTDGRKRVALELGTSVSRTAEGGRGYGVFTEIRVKPASNVVIELEPEYSYSLAKAQYVSSFTDTSASHFYDRRVVFSDLEQHTVELGTRLNLTFTPTLTLELFLQPLISSGEYESYKEFVAPRTLEKHVFDASQLTFFPDSNKYHLDADRNPATDPLTFSNPDFNFRSLRGNAVLRWEYRPGSTVFLVWTQSRESEAPVGDFELRRDRIALFDAKPDNVFLIKVNYWIGL
jgi:uncharacterized protein DUF5916